MARYSIDETTLTALGDAVRSKVGETEFRDISYESRTYTLYKENDSLNALDIPWPIGAVSVKIKILDTNTSETDRIFFGDVSYEGSTSTNALMYINTGECILTNFTGGYNGNGNFTASAGFYDEGKYVTFSVTGLDENGNDIPTVVNEEVLKTMTPERMATEINGLQAMSTSLLNLTGRLDYKFYNGNWDDFIEIYGDQITTKDVTGLNYMFSYCYVENIPFEINCKVNTLIDMKQFCSGASKLLESPIINNLKVNDLQQAFKGCQSIRYFPEGYGEDWDWSYITSATSGYYGYKNGMFEDCYSLRQLPMELFKHNNPYLSYSYSPLREFRNMYSLDEVVDMPFTIDTAFNGTSYSSPFYNSFTGLYRCKEFTFAPDIGVKKWAKQVLDFSKLGYGYSSGFYNSGITADKEVKNSTTYTALKDDPDWFAISSDYSRYSMDAMIRTINSLPDCSEYAAANGTNTIKFNMTAGRGYGKNISSLPEETAAIAAAKGWTVTFV